MDRGQKLILGFTMTLILIAACFGVEEEGGESRAIEEWHMQGQIGRAHEFQLKLVRQGKALSGQILNTQNQVLQINGTLHEDGTFLLHEHKGEERTGTFQGRFLSDGSAVGLWTAPGRRKWFPFNWVKKTPSSFRDG